MATNYYSRREIDFQLYEVHDVLSLTELPFYAEHNKEIFDMSIDTAAQIGDKLMFPFFTELDRNAPDLVDGMVKVHSSIKPFLKAMGESGIIGADFPFEDGGSQLPISVTIMMGHILMAANNGMMYTGLTSGSARLIANFGSKDLKDRFIPKMLDGSWQGTMCLTEPQAGSSLTDITTSAKLVGENIYKLKGQKIFITAGDHDACDNVIHLVIARIEGAPLGTKGISLFVVPKLKEDGSDNHVESMGIYHKMGQRGVPAMHLGFEESEGYLVGEENKGLSYMFQMMNEARIGVGMTGASIATAAYHASLEYAKERPQSRRLHRKSNLDSPQIPIIQHPDVRRMLFSQKSIVEGSLSLIAQVSYYFDKAHAMEDKREAKFYASMLDLLTPVVKTYPCEAGMRSTNDALQVFGGYGFTEDFPAEQYYRDIRITPIYEGTTGIQSQDLLGRKVSAEYGANFRLFTAEIKELVKEAKDIESLQKYASRLTEEVAELEKVTTHLMKKAVMGDIELFLSDANLYMEVFSNVTIAWQWLKMGMVATQKLLITSGDDTDALSFYESKLQTMKYYFHYEVPKTKGLIERLLDEEVITLLRGEEIGLA